MTVTAPVPSVLHGAGLREELATAGIVVGEDDMHVRGMDLVFPLLADNQQSAVRTVVAAHTGTRPLSQRNEATIRQQAQAALATNRTFANAVKPATAAAQASAAYDASVRHSRQINGVIRLLLGLLDGTD